MRITDKTSFDIANESYKKYDIGDEITVSGNDFEIIEKRDDTQNGLRSYAFAPVVNGKPDTNNIVMGYAGTGPLSMKIVCYFTSKEWFFE